MRTNTLFIFFATVGLQAAIAASVASDERNEELSDAEDVSELQKRDQMEFDMAEIEEDQRLEDAHYLEAVGDELTEDEDSEAQQGMDNMEEEAEAEAEAEVEAEEESDSELESESESESESDEDGHPHGVKRDNIEADEEENIAQEE
ncbi:tripartite motif-containing protein 44-like isoform X2 [Megalops cyprinoides]|uniref:tripartite motif-containing protein 44-like isoform X2 n=1 Tax=Megalops cyprinoides TaxID=118141 RepID=UPI001864C10F|nr:tripartite motif-containing protein 44-like isoform X2 [Megalops cyprinoides]